MARVFQMRGKEFLFENRQLAGVAFHGQVGTYIAGATLGEELRHESHLQPNNVIKLPITRRNMVFS